MTISQDTSVEKAIEKQNDLSTAKPIRLAWRSTWLDQRAYQAVNHDPEPLKRGLFAFLVALVAAGISRLIGIGLGILTSPQIGIIQEQINTAITDTSFFGKIVERTPEFAEQFNATYSSIWGIIRLLGGYPSYAGLSSSLIFLLFILISWFVYTITTNVVAYWLGSNVDLSQALGVFALAYCPIMLTVVKIIPGANVPWILIFLLILVGKFLAAREVYQLGSIATLAVLLLPYLIGIILLFNLLIFGAAFGLNEIPYVDEILRTLRFAGRAYGIAN
jgi:hypothetical protein